MRHFEATKPFMPASSASSRAISDRFGAFRSSAKLAGGLTVAGDSAARAVCLTHLLPGRVPLINSRKGSENSALRLR